MMFAHIRSLGWPRMSVSMSCMLLLLASSIPSMVDITFSLNMAGTKPMPVACRFAHCLANHSNLPTMLRHLGEEKLVRALSLSWALMVWLCLGDDLCLIVWLRAKHLLEADEQVLSLVVCYLGLVSCQQLDRCGVVDPCGDQLQCKILPQFRFDLKECLQFLRHHLLDNIRVPQMADHTELDSQSLVGVLETKWGAELCFRAIWRRAAAAVADGSTNRERQV